VPLQIQPARHYTKWLVNTTLVTEGFDSADPTASEVNQRKMMLAIHHSVLHAKTMEAKVSEEISDIKQMLIQLGAKVGVVNV
jgi:hypothetical protein